MRSEKKQAQTADAPTLAPVPIHATAVYSLETARHIVYPPLARSCLAREIRLGRLRAIKRAGRIFLLGELLLHWLRGGELKRRSRPSAESTESTCSNEAMETT
jgi:hypothetical protein